ncbi:hypothetical protein HWV62_31977 [Athelia sp. TMB]|nr:hypothetical protein HWV62_31977 [Athelia sp. TMB]
MLWIYQLLIDGWGDITAFESGGWLLAADPMVAAIVACMVQGFFAWRLQIVAQQAWLTTFIIICSACTLLGGIGTGIAVLWVKSYALFGTFKPIASIWLISATIADITITLALTYHLRRRRGSFGATDRLLDRIVQLTIQNGFLTALVSVVDISLYLSTPKPYHICEIHCNPVMQLLRFTDSLQALSFLMPKLYSNTVLSSLNARRELRPLANATVEDESRFESRYCIVYIMLEHKFPLRSLFKLRVLLNDLNAALALLDM